MSRWSVGIAALLVLLAGLSPVEAQSPRTVENPRPTWRKGEELRLSASPTLVIGTGKGEMQEFSKVAGAARLKDGRIVVADGGSLSLRFFSATGAFLKSVGRRGEGPGEFRDLSWFAVLEGDTLVAGSMIRDASYFDGGGNYLARRGMMNPPVQLSRAGLPVLLASLDGSGHRAIAVMGRPVPRVGTAHWVDSMPVAIVEDRNSVVHDLGMFPSMEVAMDGANAREVWFSPTAVFTKGRGGFFIGFGGEYAIRAYSADGMLRQVIRRVWRPVPVTKAEINSYVVEWGKRWIKSTGAEAAAEREGLANAAYAATVPAFSQFIVDRVNRLWVREAHLADAPGAGAFNTMPLVPSKWSVFAPTGVWLGDVTMPERFTPTDIGADYVVGTATDADDVQSVVIYRLGR